MAPLCALFPKDCDAASLGGEGEEGERVNSRRELPSVVGPTEPTDASEAARDALVPAAAGVAEVCNVA